MPLDWSLLKMPDVGKSVMEGFEQGRKVRREEQSRNALTTLLGGGAQGQVPGAHGGGIGGGVQERRAETGSQSQANIPWGDLTPEDMRTAVAIQQAQREQAKGQRETDFNRAAFDYTSGQNALLTLGDRRPAPTASVNALAPQTMEVPGTFAPALPDQARQQEPKNPAFTVLGEPRTNNDKAFLRMLEIDPAKAVKFKSELRDNFVKMVGQEHDMYAEAVDRLALATDENSYQQVIAEFAPRMAALGGDLSNMVPPNYPGPDGVRDITMRALDAKDRLAAFIAQGRADTYAKDVDADNRRADRNTESIINDRGARRDETRRYHDRAVETRGQGRAPRSAGGNRPAGPVKVNTPAEAMKLPKGTRYTTPDGKVMVR